MRAPIRLLVLGLVLAAGCGGASLGDGSTESCAQLQQDWSNALPAALACDPGAANQCQAYAMSAGNCSCGTTVQDPTQLDAIVVRMRAQGCIPAQQLACPCAAPFPLACVANDGGGGTCTPQPFPGG